MSVFVTVIKTLPFWAAQKGGGGGSLTQYQWGVGSLLELIESKHGAWTVEALADMLEVSPKTIYKSISTRKLNSYRIGTLIRIDPKDAADYLRRHATLPQKPQPPKPR